MSADDVSLAILAERISYERQLRAAEREAFDHERELRSVFDDHERELRTHNEVAVEKARELQFDVYATRLEALNHAAERLDAMAKTFMPIERFEREFATLRDRYEREHGALIDRHVRDIAALAAKVEEQERVTVRQDAGADLMAASKANQRWLTGIAVTSGLSLLALVLHLAGAY